jgi:putative restriction endonuclease
MADNICHDVVAGNVVCHVTLKFDSPTPALAASLGIALDRQLIAPGPDLRWHVSARLDRRIPDFAHLCGLEGCELLLPTEPRLYPKREALAWRVGQLQ